MATDTSAPADIPVLTAADDSPPIELREQERPGEFRFYALISSILVSMLLLSNILSSAKFIGIGFGIALSASAIVYPFVFLGGDILTEIYGYSRTRRVIWAGFFVFLVSTLLIWAVGVWPAAEFWRDQVAYDKVFGAVPRILLGSFLAYIVGEFSNSFTLAKLKVLMYRWGVREHSSLGMGMRFVGSTFIGQFFDSVVFFPVAFYGTMSDGDLLQLIVASWLFKTLFEAAFVPFTVPIVRWIKRQEGIDHLDEGTNFSPFKL